MRVPLVRAALVLDDELENRVHQQDHGLSWPRGARAEQLVHAFDGVVKQTPRGRGIERVHGSSPKASVSTFNRSSTSPKMLFSAALSNTAPTSASATSAAGA